MAFFTTNCVFGQIDTPGNSTAYDYSLTENEVKYGGENPSDIIKINNGSGSGSGSTTIIIGQSFGGGGNISSTFDNLFLIHLDLDFIILSTFVLSKCFGTKTLTKPLST